MVQSEHIRGRFKHADAKRDTVVGTCMRGDGTAMIESDLRGSIVAAIDAAGYRVNDPGGQLAIGVAVPWRDDILGGSIQVEVANSRLLVEVFSITAYGPQPTASPHVAQLKSLLADLTSGIAPCEYHLNPNLGVPAAMLEVVFEPGVDIDQLVAEVMAVLSELLEDYGARMPAFVGILEGGTTAGESSS